MKIPRTPPDWRTGLHRLISDPEKQQLFFNRPSPTKYLHWDRLRHLEAPKGLTSEEWWSITKCQRNSQFISTPLNDKQGNPFVYFLTQKMFETLHRIDLLAGGSISALEEVTNPETRDRYYVSSIMEESITSSLLEGAATTRSKAKEFLRSGKRPKTEAERMVINNYQTMQSLVDLKDQEFDVATILDIHRRISDGTLDSPDQEGRFRNKSEKVDVGSEFSDEIFHLPPKAEELPERVQALCDFANEKSMDGFLHPVIRSIIIHFWLAFDHPFVDGNGRTARALFYWSMLRNGFWLFEFISISRILNKAPVKYGRSFLYTETDENDLNYFILYQLEVIDRSIEELHQYLTRKSKSVSSSKELLAAQKVFNHRQVPVIERAIRDTGCTFTIKSHQNSHHIAYQTARTDLMELAEKGILTKVERGNRFEYIVAEDLIQRLTNICNTN